MHNVTLGGCKEFQTAVLQMFRILPAFELCVRAGGLGGRSTLEGTDIYNIVVKYCCLNSHLSHHGLVQKAFSERLSKASLHSLYL